MTKERTWLLISLSILTPLLIFCWLQIFALGIIPEWRHYAALALFVVLICLFFINVRMCVLGLGLYLLIATFNGLGLESTISSSSLTIGPLRTPPVQLFSLFLFILYLFANMDALIDIYLDYEDRRKTKSSSKKLPDKGGHSPQT